MTKYNKTNFTTETIKVSLNYIRNKYNEAVAEGSPDQFSLKKSLDQLDRELKVRNKVVVRSR